MRIDSKAGSVYIDIELPVVNWVGGLIAIQRSPDDDKKGPKFFVDMDSSKADVHIEGKVIYIILTCV